jgi:hypothetical protein
MKNHLIFLIVVGFSLSSCSKGANSHVEKICECFLESGLEDEYDLIDFEQKNEKIKGVLKCSLPIIKEFSNELSNMDVDERADYFGETIKAAVDCECGHKILLIGAKFYDNKIVNEEIEGAFEQIEFLLEHSSSNSFGFFNNNIDVEADGNEFCACAEKKGVDKTKCHDEWVEKYKGVKGSAEEGEKLGEKMVECDFESALSVLSKMSK